MKAALYGGGALLAVALVVGAVLAARKYLPEVLDELADRVSPLNRDNVFAKGADSVARVVTGDEYDTVGTAWWKFWNPGAVAAEGQLLDRPGGAGATGTW